QAVLHRYETFHLASGHVVKLPMDRGEGQQWNRAPGNLYCVPRKVRLDPRASSRLDLVLTEVIPPVDLPRDTRFVRHVRVESALLSRFWGRPMHLGAHVLVPDGFDDHPEARYPLVLMQGHFPSDFGGFREEPPDDDAPPVRSVRFGVDAYNRVEEGEAHDTFRWWTAADTPRVLIVEIQHPTPYYDDSYAVDSECMGPYGEAIHTELLPEIERRFRAIGEGWARFLYGGSTGGWSALATQVFYPDHWNGAWCACPDPVDFRAYCLVNLYDDANAHVTAGPFRAVERPGKRDGLGHVDATMADLSRYEAALGSRGRSGEQLDAWQAVYSPRGDDGYPRPIWDKETGVIDHEVAASWRENYDLRHILERDWATLGPKLRGKLHVYVGTMDNFYLDGAVRLLERFLASTTDPPYEGEVDYGCGCEHCWNGDHDNPIHISRLRYHRQFLPRIVARLAASAPEGADLTSWRY
ncbi:MAG: hypothetical protein KC635_19335, partial [Myxococcales bacterium]|nr:hypothetical protein [Myxococcales bacterium]